MAATATATQEKFSSMLAYGKVKEVERLLAEGRLSQRKIAQAAGVSRGVVSLIASGKRPDYEARRLLAPFDEEPSGPIERCPSCGGRVYMPCRLCRVRSLHEVEQARLKQLRRRARQQALRRLLVAVLRAASEAQLLDVTPRSSLPAGGQTPSEPTPREPA